MVLCRTMTAQIPVPLKRENFVARHPAGAYFALTFAVLLRRISCAGSQYRSLRA